MAMSPRRRHCDLAATSQSGRRYITWQLLHIGITFLSKCDVAATSQWSHLATFIQKITLYMATSLRLLCDVAIGSQTIHLATFVYKSHFCSNAMSQRHRSQVTWRLSYVEMWMREDKSYQVKPPK